MNCLRTFITFLLPLLLLGCVSSTSMSVSDPDAILDVSKVTTPPEPIYQRRPFYPANLAAQRVTGEALIYFVVRKDGSVSDVKIVSATNSQFGDAGAASVTGWRFRPGMLDGRPVNCQLEVPLMFNMDK